MKILVVDADKISRMIVDECVSVLGHETHHAENGKQGLAYAKENSIDLIFLGDQIPDLNGALVAKIIREFKKEEWIPIIFLTAKTTDEFYGLGMLVGADACIQKPINPAFLQSQVAAIERLCVMRKKLLAQQNLVKANQYLISISMVDQLTCLGNRRNFEKLIVKEFNLAKRENTMTTLLICDIDYFKVFNKIYGYDEGDKRLIRIAETIQKMLNRPSDIACRIGSDEFVAILPRTDAKGGLVVAEKIRQAVYNSNLMATDESKPEQLTLSIGVANFKGQYIDPKDFIQAANDALYEAKSAGRNRVDLTL